MKKKLIITALILLPLLGAGIYLYITSTASDSPETIEQTRKKLRHISQAVKLFQSEQYFGKAPKSLEDLSSYQTTFFNAPERNIIYAQSDDQDSEDRSFIETTDSYSLIPNRRVFLKSGVDKEDEDERLAENPDFITDFGFLPTYRSFLPSNTIIAWDNPGNFNTGGNILFEDGQIKFIKASPEEYRRFTTALQTQTDRNFVRDICIRNNTDCSLADIRQEPAN